MTTIPRRNPPATVVRPCGVSEQAVQGSAGAGVVRGSAAPVLVRYWMATPYACGLLIVRAERLGTIVGGCPIYRRWRGQTLRAFFAYHERRGGCVWEEIVFEPTIAARLPGAIA